MAQRVKRGPEQIADNLGWDIEDVKASEYHPGHWSQKVYTDEWNNYWSVGPRAPRYRDGSGGIVWQLVDSYYPGNPPLWKGRSD